MDNPVDDRISRSRFLMYGSAAVAAGCSGGGASPVPTKPAAVVTASSATPRPTATPSLAQGTGGQPSVVAKVTVDRSNLSGNLAAGFAGLSYEKSVLSSRALAATNLSLAGCFAQLGPSILRIGGNSVDRVVWNPRGAGRTYGEVAASDIAALASFLKMTGWRVLYGINLANSSPAAAAEEALAAWQLLGTSIYAFEIGNEPDQYVAKGLRSNGYTFSNFLFEWTQWATAITAVVPLVPLTGPGDAANVFTWTIPFAARASARIELLTQHYYRADGRSPDSTLSLLLQPDTYLLKELRGLRDAVTAHGIAKGYRINECNSFYNGGSLGISDAHGTALWAVDFMLLNASYGAAGVNFHGGGDGSGYTPIADNGMSVAGVRPVYYGMRFLTQIAPGQMYTVFCESQPSVTSYAVAGNDGHTYVAVINKAASPAVDVSIDVGTPVSGGTMLALTGPSLAATSGTLLGGTAIASDGSWTNHKVTPVKASGPTVTATVPPASAALFKLR